MISILHLSDLHIVQSAHWNNIRASILEEARTLHDKPRGEKLLVLTGDYRNFGDEDYSKAEEFLSELFQAMDIAPETDVFAVPGNHDVGNAALMKQCFPGDEDWDMRQSMSVEWLKNHKNSETGYARYLRWRMESYRPFCDFLSRLGIHNADTAAAPHVRCWRGKLNIFHLNTTLIYEPKKYGNQRVDLKEATEEALWKDVPSDKPALALGHNNFYDLEKAHQEGLIPVFLRHGVCAYLCGDTHKKNLDRNQKRIFLTNNSEDGNDLQIPNVVGIKGAADESDNFSDFGLYWHCWDTELHKVDFLPLEWKPDVDQASFEEGKQRSYPMPRGDKAPPAPIPPKPPIKEDISPHLADTMTQTRKNHPSFKLMRPDELDRRLFPNIRDEKQLTALGSVGGETVCPVWDLIVRSWREGRNRSIVLTGAGGIGKTVALLSPEGAEAQSVPALYVPLFELVEQEKDVPIEAYLQKRLGDFYPQFDALARHHWEKKPSLLLLLDGVNELPARYRFDVIHNVNDWARDHGGVQLVAVSRPLDGLNLGQELANDPISIQLSPLEREKVSEYLTDLGREIPGENDPIWKVLVLPLFLVLYAKTGKLDDKSACGYPLAPKPVTGGGALIWNYLQRELLRKGNERWVLECAVACEYLLPAVGYEMVKNHRFTIQKADLDRLLAETLPGLSEELPNHLKKLFNTYDDKYGKQPKFDDSNSKLPPNDASTWRVFLVHDTGLLTRYKGDENTFTFIHQHFRDAFAGLYLVNAAEAETVAPVQTRTWNPAEAKAHLPELWQRSQPPLAMEYAAELMEEETAKELWDALRALWPEDQKQQPANRAALYMQLELHRLRDDLAGLDFSGMDLRGISLIRYEKGLFRRENSAQWKTHTRGTKLDAAAFQGVGHSGPVYCVTALPDGRIVSGSGDESLRVWDSYTGDCLRVLEGHTWSVWCVTALPDGRIVSGAGAFLRNDKTLRVWDPNTGESRVLEGHRSTVYCVTALPDGRIVSGSRDNTLRVWEPDTGTCLRVLEEHTNRVQCVTALPDGHIVSGAGGFLGNDKTLRVWDPDSGNCLRVLEGHTDDVNCVTALPDGRIVSGSSDHTLRVWDPNTGDCLRVLEGHTNWVRCVTALPDGRIVSGSWDNTLRVWEPDTETCLRVLKGHRGSVNCVTALPDGRIVSGSEDNTLRIWSSEGGEPLACLGQIRPEVHCSAMAGENQWVSGHNDGTLRLWDSNTGIIRKMLLGHIGPVLCVTALPDGRIVSGSGENTLRVWDPDSGDCLRVLKGHTGSVYCVTALPDGRIVSGSYEKTLRVWNPDNGDCLRVLEGHTNRVWCVTALPDGCIASGSWDNTLRVWDSYTGDCLRVLEGHTSSVTCLTALPDGRIVSGSNDNTLRVWDSYTGDCLRVLKGHTDSVHCGTALPNGRILSGSRDNTLRVWDPDAGNCLGVLEGHTDSIRCVITLPHNRILSGSYDCTFRIWDVNSGKCLAVIPVSEMDLTGMELSQADYPPDLAALLYYNGAAIRPADAARLKKHLNP